MGRLVSFFAELRERRFIRILFIYLTAGWFALQAADQLVGQGLLPAFSYRLALIWYVVGVPACILLAWHHGEKGRQKAPPSEVVLLTLLAVVAVGLSISPVSTHYSEKLRLAAAESALDLRKMAVLYFRDLSPGGEHQYLADGLTEDLITELDQVRTLDVISRNGVAQFREARISRDSIARLLGVGTLVDGSIEQIGERVRVSIRLVDGGSGAEFQRAGFELPAGDLLAVRDSVVGETSRVLREWLGEEIQVRRARTGTRNTGAWVLFQRAEKIRKDAEALAHAGDAAGTMKAFQTADSLLVQAEILDREWPDPIILRGTIAYRKSRLAHSAHEAVRPIHEGLGHAERALRLSPRSARAMELRGTIRYWHHLLRVTPDPAEHAQLLQSARNDLEAAIQIDRNLASAHSTLSHLYYRYDELAGVVLAAQRAYEADAYLELANDILFRLTMGSYDLEQFTQARRWCDEGTRRFPDDYRFSGCQLVLMTTPDVEPKVDQAWALLAKLNTTVPDANRAYEHAKAQMFVSGILARAGLPDSARAVLRSARASVSHEVDPTGELFLVEAHMYNLNQEPDRAVEVLKRYATGRAHYSLGHYWWWHSLRSNPRFQELAAAGQSEHR